MAYVLPKVNVLHHGGRTKCSLNILHPGSKVHALLGSTVFATGYKREELWGNLGHRSPIDLVVGPELAAAAVANGPNGGSPQDGADIRIMGDVQVAPWSCGSVCWSHNQRVRRAMPARCMSLMPSPPREWGRQTLYQFTMHWPPFASLLLAQRNPWIIWLTFFRMD